MKRTCLLFFVMCFLAGSVFAATIDTFRYGSGTFLDVDPWENGGPTSGNWTGTSSSDEIKFTYDDTVCTVDADSGVYVYKAAFAAGNAGTAPTLQIVDGGSLTLGEVKFGDGGATSRGKEGIGIQTGGTFTVGDLELGYKAGGIGYYTISGGTLTYSGNGRIKLGAEGADGATGNLTVVGNAASIMMKDLYVGEYGGDAGTGNLEFQIGAAGVSAVQLNDDFVIDGGGEDSVANLLLSAMAPLAAADILLVHNTGSKAVVGIFDTMNGGSAAEGTTIALGGNMYSLTYVYDADSDSALNDLALVYIPEPATMVLLGLGGLLAIRRKR